MGRAKLVGFADLTTLLWEVGYNNCTYRMQLLYALTGRMAYVAFDLDRTLGFFEFVNPLAFLWSKDLLLNPEHGRINPNIRISRKLELQLARARETFARSILADPNLFFRIIRPDIEEILTPLRKPNVLKAAIIYSNTGVSYSVELAKFLIETKYKVPNFFSLTADNWHPLRTEDRIDKFTEPKKTIGTLQKLFRRAAHVRKDIPLKNILFVDDRIPKHDLTAQEKDGLTYMNIQPYVPSISKKQIDEVLFLAVAALDKNGLLRSSEYLESSFCNRNIPYDNTKQFSIHGFRELLSFVKESMYDAKDEPINWRKGTPYIKRVMSEYLS